MSKLIPPEILLPAEEQLGDHRHLREYSFLRSARLNLGWPRTLCFSYLQSNPNWAPQTLQITASKPLFLMYQTVFTVVPDLCPARKHCTFHDNRAVIIGESKPLKRAPLGSGFVGNATRALNVNMITTFLHDAIATEAIAMPTFTIDQTNVALLLSHHRYM